jgi:preprotein translocase subunit YajC
MHVAFLIAQDSESSDPNLLVSLVPFLLIGLIMYFILIRPQRKRMREQAQLQSSVGVGDEVITTSGMFGFITGEDGPDRFWLEIDDDVQVRVARAAIQRKVDTSATEDDKAATPAKSDDADEQ